MERNHYKFPRFTHFPWEAVNITSYSGGNDSLDKPPRKSLRRENQVEDLTCRDQELADQEFYKVSQRYTDDLFASGHEPCYSLPLTLHNRPKTIRPLAPSPSTQEKRGESREDILNILIRYGDSLRGQLQDMMVPRLVKIQTGIRELSLEPTIAASTAR